jgi:hypothetical protein
MTGRKRIGYRGMNKDHGKVDFAATVVSFSDLQKYTHNKFTLISKHMEVVKI